MTGEPDSAPAPATTPASAATAVPPPVPSRWPRALRPFRHREYRLLTASMAVSLVASGMWAVGAGVAGHRAGRRPHRRLDRDDRPVGGMLVSVLIGGVAADRLPRRGPPDHGRVDPGRHRRRSSGVAGRHRAAAGCGTSPSSPSCIGAADGVLLPRLHRAAAHDPAGRRAAGRQRRRGHPAPRSRSPLGPALAGVLIGAFAPSIALLGPGSLYGIALLTLLVMRPLPPPAVSERRSSVAQDLRERLRLHVPHALAVRHPGVRLAAGVPAHLGPIEVLLPFAVRDQTGSGPAVTRSPSALTASAAMAARSPPRRSPCRAATSRS